MTRMTPSEALVETLAAYGVSDVFGIVGSAYMDALDIFPAAGIRFVPTIHEQGSAHMADGYARASGKYGVCIAQNGPGITNFVTAIAAAYWAHSPVIAITPETGSMGMGLGGFQETEQLPIFSKITKYQGHVARPERMAEMAGRCFEYAAAERGPAQLNIPRDYFYGEADYAIPVPRKIGKGAGDENALQEAAELLANAKFPVIIAGGGVVFADGVEECKALAERLDCPVVNSYLHNDSFPCDHPLWAGPLGYQGSKAGMKLLARADVVLALGSRLGPFGTLPQYGMEYWPKDAKLIQVDADHRMLGLTRPATVSVCGDARAAATSIVSRLQNMPPVSDAKTRRKIIADEKDAWEKELEEWAHEKDEWSRDVMKEGGMHPRQMLRELEKAMPENAMVTTDIGNICSVSNSYLRFRKPNSFFAAMSFGNCGYAFPTAIGAKLAAPERPAVAYVGDGAWGMSFGEILTCVRENIPVTAVVFNNRQWGAEKKNQVDFYGNRFLGVNLDTPQTTDFSAIARAMGAEAHRIENLGDVGEALDKACAAQKSGKTTILEMMVTRELGDPFRRDALKKPMRMLPKYKDYS